MGKVAEMRSRDGAPAATITRAELLAFDAALAAVTRLSGGIKFTYGVAKNQRLIEAEVAAIRKACAPVEGMAAFYEARIVLCKEHARKDDDGAPMIEGDAYVMADPPAFEAAFAELRARHADTIAAQEAHEKEIYEWLAGAVTVPVHRIEIGAFPDGLTAEHIRLFWPIIDEGA